MSAHVSLGSQAQKRSQAICAQIAAKINPPRVNIGNPIATERYIISSTKFGLTLFKSGCTFAPILFLNTNRIKPYKIVPERNDHISVFNFLGASLPCIQFGASKRGVILSGVTSLPPLGPAIAGK